MPNYGRSGRCRTCKRRRVKCDEARPACSPCRYRGITCEGYAKDYSFRDQSHKFPAAAPQEITSDQRAPLRRSAAAEEPSRSLLISSDVAVPFFLGHYAGMGRSLAAARGFYEILIPVYNSEPHDSPLSLAISAVATQVFSLWRPGDVTGGEAEEDPYPRAVASLRSALERPNQRQKPATGLAILALHLYECITAVFSARRGTSVHHNGALSLLPLGMKPHDSSLITGHIKGFVLHTEISSALRQKREIHPTAYSYLQGPHTSPLVPGNFSSILDSIGVSVAQLQADYERVLSGRTTHMPLPQRQVRTWIAEVERINILLYDWAQSLPDHWWPIRLTSGPDFSPSVAAYQSICDVYPSCQIATLWNLWRFHRLLLHKVTIGVSQFISKPTWDESGNEAPPAMDSEKLMQVAPIQELVDEICYSIPFYIGNRSQPSTLTGFVDRTIIFPCYHSLVPNDARITDFPQDAMLSKDEHHRHMLAYGVWHAVSPLSNLLALVSDDHGGRQVASCLRSGQLGWICEQFLRVGKVLRLPVAEPPGALGGPDSSTMLPNTNLEWCAAEALAKQVRKGAVFMSGP